VSSSSRRGRSGGAEELCSSGLVPRFLLVFVFVVYDFVVFVLGFFRVGRGSKAAAAATSPFPLLPRQRRDVGRRRRGGPQPRRQSVGAALVGREDLGRRPGKEKREETRGRGRKNG